MGPSKVPKGFLKVIQFSAVCLLFSRLRQICNHPGLIKSMLDSQAKVNEGLIKDQADDLVSQMADMSIGEFVYIFYPF